MTLGMLYATDPKSISVKPMPVAGSGYAEIGVVTHSDQRGKGYAKWILSYLIKQCG